MINQVDHQMPTWLRPLRKKRTICNHSRLMLPPTLLDYLLLPVSDISPINAAGLQLKIHSECILREVSGSILPLMQINQTKMYWLSEVHPEKLEKLHSDYGWWIEVSTSRFETSHDLFKWTTCTEGHTFHRACVSPSRNGASLCPTCEELAPHIEHLQIQEPIPQSPERSGQLLPGKAPEPQQADRCAICLAEWGDQDVIKTWPECAHNFHEGCVSPWRDLHSTCPICRTIDPALLEKENVSVRQQEQVHHEEVFTPLMESFMRILTQIGIPRDQNETDQVNHLRQFFRERQDAHEARTRETFPPSENQ
ncbi:hypothetical protein H4Q26_012367 [Puccinia striiformis f. sp. tritici PST-130]|nr:hypothetical protein H4Q26_012367 [Puccinia striiformis f. sp. tritici PST-130]